MSLTPTSGWPAAPTPAALLDTRRLRHNIDRMQRHLGALGVRLRPHVKTAKCAEVAHMLRAAGAQGLTVSTLKEAQVFFDAGFNDILYAVGIAPGKLDAAAALIERGCALTLVVDSVEAAQVVVQRLPAVPVLIEIDVDGQRAGVTPDGAALIEIGRTLDAGGSLAGVMTHAGGAYHHPGLEALAEFAQTERGATVAAAERLRAAGLPCWTVSVGSTPTATAARALPGVTEVRAGVYVFHDLVMAGLGVCGIDDIALSVLASVIGHQPAKGWTLIDAGWTALSRDQGTADHAVNQGYGLVCLEDGTPTDCIVSATNQEHGIVTRREGVVVADDVRARFPLGSRVRVLPIHACATASQFERYHLVGGPEAGTTWERFGGW